MRHIDEIIRANRWYTGADKDMIAGLFHGKLMYLVNPSLVVAVARACHAIAGEDFTLDDAQPLILASHRIQILMSEAKAADERMVRNLPALRGTTDVVPTRAVPEIKSPRRRRYRIAAGVPLLAACALVGVLYWPQSAATENPDYRVPVSRPTQQELDNDPQHCASRSAVVNTGRGEASGSIRLRECRDFIELWLADLDRDSRCVYADISWSAESRERSDEACPAGEIAAQRIAKKTSNFQVELVSTYRP